MLKPDANPGLFQYVIILLPHFTHKKCLTGQNAHLCYVWLSLYSYSIKWFIFTRHQKVIYGLGSLIERNYLSWLKPKVYMIWNLNWETILLYQGHCFSLDVSRSWWPFSTLMFTGDLFLKESSSLLLDLCLGLLFPLPFHSFGASH